MTAVGLTAGLVPYFLLRGDEDTSVAPAGSGSTREVVTLASARAVGPRTASLEELRSLPAALGHSVFWAGPRPRTKYELTQTEEGRIYIRYLPPGVPAGTRSRRFLTVATYPLRNAFTRTVEAAGSSRVRYVRIRRSQIAYYRLDRPTSVFFARRGLDFQVEVFDPSPATARRIVQNGRLRPIR